MKKILIILGHERTDSLCGALATAYEIGVRTTGAQVERINLADIPARFWEYGVGQPDANETVDLIRKQFCDADHLVFVYPVWWGAMPSRMKGLLERVLHPGVAFKYYEGSSQPEKLWKGKTARALVTMDAPGFFNSLFYRNPSKNMLSKCMMWFCGVKMTGWTEFHKVLFSKPKQRAQWLQKAQSMGQQDAQK